MVRRRESAMLGRGHELVMPDRSQDRPFDYDVLADFLSALGYPARLELLHVLRFPHVLGEIRLSARRSGGGRERPGRLSSKPAVQGHLDKLEAAGLVRFDEVDQAGRPARRYVVNSLKLYELTEEVRRLSVIYAGRGPAGDHTGTLASGAAQAQPRGPRLTLVHGLYEGKIFSLDPATAPDGQWVIGRRRGLPVALDYDPFVSLENSVVTHEAGSYLVADLPGSKNGTMVNWVPLPKGGSHLLKGGDVVGVGRSMLCFAPS
jgi:DNA-binding transcriptional ArsR family regulator